ncbi:MAG: hypothetical protein KY444_10765, partial [Gemmatimonadetes bacterium]|nr:hypothetical protein [Gemmatimonadota bacterium]
GKWPRAIGCRAQVVSSLFSAQPGLNKRHNVHATAFHVNAPPGAQARAPRSLEQVPPAECPDVAADFDRVIQVFSNMAGTR